MKIWKHCQDGGKRKTSSASQPLSKTSSASQRLEWLSLLRGLNILLVVMFHVQLVDLSTGGNHLFCEQVCLPFNAVRMPLFIFLSGGLLYLSRIRKQWEVRALYIDKAERIVVPFVFFVTFFYCFKAVLNPLVKTKAELSWSYFLESFAVYYEHPSAHLWFLATLTQLMLLYPLFCWLCRRVWHMVVFAAFAVVFYFADLSVFDEYNYFFIMRLNKYLVYFFLGIFFFRYELWQWLRPWWSLLWLVPLYAVCCWQEVALLSSVAGIAMMVAAGMQLARCKAGMFSSFREYIFPIYLMSFIFQPFVELVLWRRLFYNEDLFFLFYALNVLAGLYGPVLVCKAVERVKYRPLRLCFGIK